MLWTGDTPCRYADLEPACMSGKMAAMASSNQRPNGKVYDQTMVYTCQPKNTCCDATVPRLINSGDSQARKGESQPPQGEEERCLSDSD